MEAATVVLTIIAGIVAITWMVVKVIGRRIDELVAAMDRAEARADVRHAASMDKFRRFD